MSSSAASTSPSHHHHKRPTSLMNSSKLSEKCVPLELNSPTSQLHFQISNSQQSFESACPENEKENSYPTTPTKAHFQNDEQNNNTSPLRLVPSPQRFQRNTPIHDTISETMVEIVENNDEDNNKHENKMHIPPNVNIPPNRKIHSQSNVLPRSFSERQELSPSQKKYKNTSRLFKKQCSEQSVALQLLQSGRGQQPVWSSRPSDIGTRPVIVARSVAGSTSGHSRNSSADKEFVGLLTPEKSVASSTKQVIFNPKSFDQSKHNRDCIIFSSLLLFICLLAGLFFYLMFMRGEAQPPAEQGSPDE